MDIHRPNATWPHGRRRLLVLAAVAALAIGALVALRGGVGETPRPPVTDLARADPYLDVIEPLLRLRCGGCHRDERRGGYSMATYESTLAGGDNVTAIVPGNPRASELLRRVTLPPDDEAFMPAEGETPLTSAEIAILEWWIAAGAPRNTTLGRVALDPSVAELIASELGLRTTDVVAPTN